MKMQIKLLMAGILCMCTVISHGQQKVNLAKVLKKSQIEAVNRAITPYDKTPEAVEMNAAEGDGLGIVKEVSLASLLTSRMMRPMRPFIFVPLTLLPPSRSERSTWFSTKIVVSEKSVQVYVNDLPEAVLKVDRLVLSGSSKIGLWTGNGSSGRYRNLVITEK